MELSIFLAKWLGIYLLILAAILLLRKHDIETTAKEIVASRGLLLLSGSLSLLGGLAIVISHHVYELNWRGLVTLLGYLLIVRGILRIAFPGRVKAKAQGFFHKRYWLVFFIVAIVGLFLTYSGFKATAF